MKSTQLTALALSLTLVACSDKPGQPAQTPSQAESVVPVALKVDLSSPDRAVKSWWSYKDSVAAQDYQDCVEFERNKKPGAQDDIPKVAQEAVLKSYQAFAAHYCQQPSRYAREIQEVKMETETRAIVYAHIKDVTPPPPNAIPNDSEKRWREEGARAKYLFEKASAGWKLSQVYEYNRYTSDGSPEWKEVYTDSDLLPAYPSLVLSRNL